MQIVLIFDFASCVYIPSCAFDGDLFHFAQLSWQHLTVSEILIRLQLLELRQPVLDRVPPIFSTLCLGVFGLPSFDAVLETFQFVLHQIGVQQLPLVELLPSMPLSLSNLLRSMIREMK